MLGLSVAKPARSLLSLYCLTLGKRLAFISIIESSHLSSKVTAMTLKYRCGHIDNRMNEREFDQK